MRNSLLGHHLAHHRIGRIGLVDGDDRIGAAEGRPGDDAILPGLLLILQDRVVGHVDVAFLHVEVAGDRRKIERLHVGEVGEAHLVEVGQLVARRIDADVVRVAPQREHRIAGARDRRPRRHGRALGILRRGVPVGEQLGPGLEAGRLRCLVDVFLGRVRRVELLEVMRRQEHREGAVGAILVGDGGQEQRRWRGVGEAHRVVVDLLDLGGRAVGVLDPARQGRRQLLVEQDVVVPEQDVVGGEGLAVRPARALAQVDRPDLVVGRGLGARARSWARSWRRRARSGTARRRRCGCSCWRRPARGRRGATPRHTRPPSRPPAPPAASREGAGRPAAACRPSPARPAKATPCRGRLAPALRPRPAGLRLPPARSAPPGVSSPVS